MPETPTLTIQRLTSRNKEKSPTREELRRAAGFRLALRHFYAATERVVRSCGITPRQYLLLLVLESSGQRRPLTIGQLSESLGLVPSTMTELVDRAEQAGLLKRVHAQDDGRVFHVCATKEGRRRFVKAFRQLEHERRAVAEEGLRLLEDLKTPS